jgi:hypothetical protein
VDDWPEAGLGQRHPRPRGLGSTLEQDALRAAGGLLLLAGIKVADALFVQLADEVTDADLAQRLRFKNYQGVDQERNFGGLILHTFNHQTHHRGGVSLYLDILGKANDFSGIAPLI